MQSAQLPKHIRGFCTTVNNLRGSFLATALASGGEEHSSRLARELLRAPQVARAIHERFELRRHHAEPGREPEEEAVGLDELAGRDDRHIGLLRRSADLGEHFVGEGLWDLRR